MVGASALGQQQLATQAEWSGKTDSFSGPPLLASVSHAGTPLRGMKEKQSFQKPLWVKSESSGTAPRTKNVSCAMKVIKLRRTRHLKCSSHLAESLCHSPETITTLLISYTPIWNKKLKKNCQLIRFPDINIFDMVWYSFNIVLNFFAIILKFCSSIQKKCSNRTQDTLTAYFHIPWVWLFSFRTRKDLTLFT